MKIVVTGGGGFIGANLIRKLLQKGDEVHTLTREGSNLWRLKEVASRIKIHTGLLSSPKKLTALMDRLSPDIIYHLATYGSYPNQKDIKQMINTNITSTLNLLESLSEVPYKNLIVAGSSSEYGNKNLPIKETDVLEPNNFYAVCKAAQTQLCQAFAKNYHKPVVILRFFSVYGPFEQQGRLVRSTVESVLKDQPIKLATGKEARDFIFIEDVIDAMLYASNKSFFGEVFNIGTGVQTTIAQLAQMVVAVSGKKVPIKLNVYPGRSWDTNFWVADMHKTDTILKWKPKVSLKEGLKKTIAWYKNEYKTA